MNKIVFSIMIMLYFLSNIMLISLAWSGNYSHVEELPKPDRQLLCNAFPNIEDCSGGGTYIIACEDYCVLQFHECMDVTINNIDYCSLILQKCITDCNREIIEDIVLNNPVDWQWLCINFPFLKMCGPQVATIISCEQNCEMGYYSCMDVSFNNHNFCSVLLERCIVNCNRDVIVY